ncbi:YadA family autotransporter adhesin [Pseudomonas sp. RL_15y_Pfl2_60]|uniref:YadA family autotransporter adhesin n=1 Tax=Pseudomonas sp. RL_15y_Pfl2_60 TaxID=3088709 RepID=UPI0030DA4E23
MAAGIAASAAGESAVAAGHEAQASAGNSVAVGNGANASAEGGVALGGGSMADRAAGTAGYVPDGASDTQQAAIAATTSTQGAVSVGDAASGQFRQITGVAAGSEDSDAVNVAQLKAAGDATSDEIEASKTHYYSVNDGGKQSANYNNDGATGNNAIAAGTNASAAGKSAVAMGDGAQAAAASSVAIGNNAKATTSNSVALGSNSVASRDNSVSVGTAGNERQITNVAAGTADTDAVNVSQLEKSTGDINNRIDNTYNSLRHDLKDQDDTLSAGIAGAMAAAALPQPYSPGASMVSAGAGNYRGQSSLAIGVSTISDNGKWVSKLAGTADSQGEFGVSVGVGYQW